MLTIESYRWNVTLNWIISFKFPNNINSLLFSHWNYSFYFKRKYISIRSFCYEMQTGKHISRRKKVLKCRMSVCLFVHLSIRLSIRLSVCLSVCPSHFWNSFRFPKSESEFLRKVKMKQNKSISGISFSILLITSVSLWIDGN